jgi:hypothetical protein
MSHEEQIAELLTAIATVSNLAKELGVDVSELCVGAARKVLTRSVELDNESIQMILKGYSDGPAGVQ